MKKTVLPLLALGVVVAYASLPLFQPRFIPTHDGEYHIIRFFEFYGELTRGHWFPRWAPGLNSGYGLPLFIFHYPFPNYIGSLFHALGVSFVDSVKLTLALGYMSAALFCFFWLAKRFSWYAALVGASVSALVPYWFVDLYVRGSVGEVLAISFLMAALGALVYQKRIFFSVALAGIIISHNISAMIFFPFLFTYALGEKRLWVLHWVAGVALGTYFWLPALMESRYMMGLNTINFREHFPDLIQLFIPSWGTVFSQAGSPYGEMSQQIGLITLIGALWAGSAIIRKQATQQLVFFFVWFMGLVFLLTPYSQFVWERIGPLGLIQFPWRLLALIIPISAFFAASMIDQRKRWQWGGILMCCAILASFSYMRPVTYEPRTDAHYLTRREFTDGTSSLGNSFSTIWTGWKKDRPDAASEQEGDVRTFATLYYPGWEAWVDGSYQTVTEREGGIQVAAAPEARVSLFFSETLTRAISNAISLACLFWLLGSSILKIYAHRYRRTTA